MITLFSSTSYTSADYEWLKWVLEFGLTSCVCSEAPDCHTCEHKIACGDLVRFYAFVSNKADSGVDRLDKSAYDGPERAHC